MNDFEYEVLQRKRLANQAKYVKRGSKSKKCPLSTDRMTQKQWKERCGNVVSYQIGKPMKWAEFVALPNDLKEECINNLIEKYSVSAKVLAAMLGVTPVTVFRIVNKENLNIEFVKGRRMSEDQKIGFDKFLAGEPEDPIGYQGVPVAEPENTIDTIEPEPIHMETKDTKTRLDAFTMCFSGEIDVDMIANSLRYILGPNSKAKIQITCELN